jgi:hypothetical protein
MKMWQRKLRATNVITEVTCDRCQKKIPVVQYDNYAGGTITISAGYGSKHDTIDDISCDLCDNCITKLDIFLKKQLTKNKKASCN